MPTQPHCYAQVSLVCPFRKRKKLTFDSCLYHTINILLNRAKLKLSRESDFASIMVGHNPLIHCVSSATSIIVLFDFYKRTFGQGHVVLSLAYSVYTAASIFLLELQAIGHSAPNTLERLNFCIGALETLSHTNPGKQILSNQQCPLTVSPVIATALSNITKELEALGIRKASSECVESTIDATESIANGSLLPLPMDVYYPSTFTNNISGNVRQNDEPILLDPSYLNGSIEGTGSYDLFDMPPEMYEAFLQIEPLSVTMDPGFDI